MNRTRHLVTLWVMLTYFVPSFAQNACDHPDYTALAALYNATNGDNWTTSWDLSDCDVCSYFGVTCDESRKITALDLDGNNLTGVIPPEIGEFSNLTGLNLAENALSGSIPNSIGQLTSLTGLVLSSNQLSGNIPVEIGNLTELSSLFLNFNALSGEIPSSLGNLTKVIFLTLRGNNLTGSIPGSLGNLSIGEVLILDDNNLSGSLPKELSTFGNQREINPNARGGINVANNNFSGCYPLEFKAFCRTDFSLIVEGNEHLDNFEDFCSFENGVCVTTEVSCNNLQFTSESSQITVDGLTMESKVEIIGRNTNYRVITICEGNCSNPLLIPDLAAGDYAVKVNLFDGDTYCYREENVKVAIGNDTIDHPTDCEQITIQNTDNELTLTNIASPNTIAKVFDFNWQLIYNCSGDCPDTILVSNLTPNKMYHTDVQFYTENWKFICADRRDILIENIANPINDCENIQIQNQDEEIIISGLTAQNNIVKIFDPSWQIIYECTSKCADTIVVPILKTGIYRSDIQLYNEGWRFICEDKREIDSTIDNNRCDTICQGNITLRTQAEVDAFCGCETIQGSLYIGGNNSDITNLHNLLGLKQVASSLFIVTNGLKNLVGLDSLTTTGGGINIIAASLESLNGFQALTTVNGFLRIDKTRLTHLDELANLERIGGNLLFENNRSLQSLKGLSKIDSLLGITIIEGDAVYDLSELENLTYLESLYISGANLVDLNFFKKIKNVQPSIYIVYNDTITDLSGLAHFDTLSSLTLVANGKLNDVSAIKDVDYINGDLVIRFNSQLGDCCVIKRLLDSRGGAPFVGGDVSFVANKSGSSCQDGIQFVKQCPDPISPCQSVRILPLENQLQINTLIAPIEIVKIFNAEYQLVFECFADCEENILMNNLPAGVYHINIDFYDKNWQPICEKRESVELTNTSSARNRDFQVTDFEIYPNPTEEFTFIDLKRLQGKAATLALLNQFGQVVWQKVISNVGSEKVVIGLSDFPNGLYFLNVQSGDSRAVSMKLIVNRLY
ncbi:MAG: T9SS type A sorting domain-containing protein [Bacteroidota bacterium]